MTQKTKQFKQFLTFTILAGLLLVSCQVEEEITNSNSQELKGKLMHKKFEELIKETEFKTAYNKVVKPKESFSTKGKTASKTVMENQYNFTIVDKPANVVISNGITSYNFLIKRSSNPANVLENLIINVQGNQPPKAYILKFESTTPITSSFNPVTFTGIKTLTPIVYNTTQAKEQAEAGFMCETIEVWHCANHSVWQDGCEGYGSSYRLCTPIGGGGGPIIAYGGSSSSTGTGGNTGGGGINTGQNPPIVIAPVQPECPTCIVGKDPCETLTPLLAEPKILTAISDLKPETQTKLECGYAVSNGWNASGTVNGIDTQVVPGQNFSVAIPYGGLVVGGMHNHPVNGGSIPSWGDIDWLLGCENNNTPNNNDSAFNIIVAADPQNPGGTITYAITIANLAVLSAQIAADLALESLINIPDLQDKKDFLTAMQGKAFADVNGNTTATEKKFLEYFSAYGVNLSKLDPITNKWNNLNLQTPYNPKFPNAANSVVATPCN